MSVVSNSNNPARFLAGFFRFYRVVFRLGLIRSDSTCLVFPPRLVRGKNANMEYALNFRRNGKIRRVTVNGRELIIAPMRMVVPGVLNGSRGALYYPPEELAKNPNDWNNKPIVVNHPVDNGIPIPASTEGVYLKQGIGRLHNTTIGKGGELDTEGWFDVTDTRRVDDRVYNALVNETPMEISTGLFTENEPAPFGATYNGIPYQYIARNYKPDHLAVLPDQKGACSIQDGCGVLVNDCGCEQCKQKKKAEKKAEEGLEEDKPLETNAGPNQVRCGDSGRYLGKGAGTGKGPGHAEAKKGFKENPNEPNRTFRELIEQTKKLSNQGVTMNREEMIDYLVANCACWKESRTILNGFTDSHLAQLKAQADGLKMSTNALMKIASEFSIPDTLTINEMPEFIKKKVEAAKGEVEEEEEEKIDEEEEDEEEEEPVGNRRTRKTMDALLANASEEDRRTWQAAKEIEQEVRSELVNRLIANCKDTKAREAAKAIYSKMSINQLRPLVHALPKSETQSQLSNNFSGQEGAAIIFNEINDVLPTVTERLVLPKTK